MIFLRAIARHFLVLCFLPLAVFAEQKIPSLTEPVIDQANLLSTSDRTELNQVLKGLSPKIQFQIWIVPSLQDEPIENLSIRATDQWKLGTQKQDNGILILIAKQERRMRIEVGQGLEGDIPDILAGRIISQILTPAFKAGDYAGGLRATVSYIYEKISGGKVPDLVDERGREPKINWLFILFFFLILGVLNRASRGRRSSGVGSALLGGLAGGMWGSGGRGGFGGGGFGGGGWSGGGGGFSGGGSSGSW